MSTLASTVALSAHQQQALDGRWQGLAQVLGMHCGACSIALEQHAMQVAGLDELHVNPASGLAAWVASQPLAIDAFQHRIAALGYQLSFVVGDQHAGQYMAQHAQQQQRSLFLRALVALLCMMQIMMYSTPEYLYSTQQIGVQATMLLRWAQWVLSLPLLLYCARPYFERAWQALLQRRWVMDQPIALGVLLAFGVSTAQMHNLMAAVWFDSIAMLLALLLGTQWLIQRRTLQALQHLAQTPLDLPSQVQLRTQQGSKVHWQATPVLQLRQGDWFALPAHTACPVDAQVGLDAAPVWVDEAMRTGEATPVCKYPGQWVWAGSRLLGQGAVLQTLQTAQHSSFSQLGQNLQRALAQKPRHQSGVDRILPSFVLVVLLCAAGSAWAWWWLGQPGQAVAVAVAVLIVTCPCALALALPLVRLMAMHALKRAGVLVRNPEALDTLAKVNCFAFDKTGTLAPRQAAAVLVEVLHIGQGCQAVVLQQLAQQVSQASGHPVAQAIHHHLLGQASTHIDRQTAKAWPLAAVAEHAGLGLEAQWLCQGQTLRVRLGSAAWCGVDKAQGPAWPAAQQSASLAFLEVCVADNPSVCLGRLRFQLTWADVAAGTAQALQGLRQFGALHLVSGDDPAAVQAWQPHLLFDGRYGGLTAQAKTQWVAQQQSHGAVMAMVGDGLNDATAFARADVAVAVQGASALAASQADVLLTRPGAAVAMHTLMRVARQAQRVARQNLAWAVLYNSIALPFAVGGVLSPWMAALGMGLSSLLVFLNALRVGARGHRCVEGK